MRWDHPEIKHLPLNFTGTNDSIGGVRLLDPIPHGFVSTLSLVPHPQQYRVAGVDEVDDPHVGLGGMLTVKSAGVLLQRTLPRHGHRQHQGVERRMVETFPN